MARPFTSHANWLKKNNFPAHHFVLPSTSVKAKTLMNILGSYYDCSQAGMLEAVMTLAKYSWPAAPPLVTCWYFPDHLPSFFEQHSLHVTFSRIFSWIKARDFRLKRVVVENWCLISRNTNCWHFRGPRVDIELDEGTAIEPCFGWLGRGKVHNNSNNSSLTDISRHWNKASWTWRLRKLTATTSEFSTRFTKYCH